MPTESYIAIETQSAFPLFTSNKKSNFTISRKMQCNQTIIFFFFLRNFYQRNWRCFFSLCSHDRVTKIKIQNHFEVDDALAVLWGYGWSVGVLLSNYRLPKLCYSKQHPNFPPTKEQEYKRNLLSSVLVRSKHKKRSTDKKFLRSTIEKAENCGQSF